MTVDSDNLDEVRAALRADVAGVAEALLGVPSKAHSTRNTWRWGSKGSLAVEVRGPKKGLWFSHEGDEGSDLLGLIQHVHGCRFPEALAWARHWTGLEADDAVPYQPRPRPAPPPPDPAEESEAAAALAERIATAQRIATLAEPAAPDGPADWYLRQCRGIPRPRAGWPDAIRWHHGYRALVAVATAADGTVQAVQRIHLGDDGGKVGAAEMQARRLRAVKITNGVGDGAAVRLPGNSTGPLLLAEGPETGLAAWATTGHETWIALGAVGKLHPPAGRRIVVVADDDKRHSPADKARRRTLDRWRRAGLDVLPVYPWPVRREDKGDLADLILAEGPAAVKARIDLAISPAGPAVHQVPLPIARMRLDEAVHGFMDAVEAGYDTPPAHAIRVDLGVGKSHGVRRDLAALVRRLRARRDGRTAALMVPTHELAAEAAAALATSAPDLVVRVWRGRGAEAPDRAGKMCRKLDRVEEVRRLRLDVQEFACRGCPLAAECEYLAQHKAHADVWVVPAAMLERQPPKALGELAALVVDEPQGPAVVDAMLPLLDLARYDAIDGDRMAGQRLASLRNLVLDAVAELPDGPLPRAAFATLGMTVTSAAELLALEWRTLITPDLPPGAEPAVRRAALATAARNADLGRRTMLATALEALLAPDGPELSGRIEVQTTRAGVRDLHLRASREMHPRWRALPTLILDATLQLDLVRLSWPKVELVADVAVQAPHQRMRQVADGSFTLAALDAEAPGLDEEERHRRKRNLARLRVQLHAEARRHAGQVLVICNKRIKERLRELGMPANVDLAHFNALRGLDRWRDCAAVVVVGWTLPHAAALERQASAITGSALPSTGYQRAEARRELADGTGILSETWQHPDPLVEALRWSACNAELIQAIGRGRGVQRTAANPLDVLLLTDTPIPFPVELVPLDAPSPAEVQLAHGPVAYAEPSHAARAYPGLYSSGNAARMAWERWRTNPYEEFFLGTCAPPPGLIPMRYQREGAGQRTAKAWVDPGADARAVIETQQGPLAWCRVDEALTPETAPPAPAKQPEPPPQPSRAPASPPPTSAAVPPGSFPPASQADPGRGHQRPAAQDAPIPASAPTPRSALPVTADTEQADLDQRAGGLPLDLYPAGLSLSPHPAFAPYDALPVMGTWRIRRPTLPDLVVSEVARPWRVAANGETSRPPLIRVQGSDGIAEPVGLRARDSALHILATLAGHASQSPA